MGKDGGGKGKSKGGKGKGKNGKGKSGGKGKGTTPETRECWWCFKSGHIKPNCRSFFAGRPQTPKTAPTDVGSLEDGGWTEDVPAIDLTAVV